MTPKCQSTVNIVEDRAAVHRDMDKLEEWANRNLMKLNRGKCKALHLGRKNAWQQDRLIARSSAEKALWVVADSKLSMTQQCALAAKRDKSILTYINSNVASRWKGKIIVLYSALL